MLKQIQKCLSFQKTKQILEEGLLPPLLPSPPPNALSQPEIKYLILSFPRPPLEKTPDFISRPPPPPMCKILYFRGTSLAVWPSKYKKCKTF